MFSVGDRVTTPAGMGVIASTRALGLHGEEGVFVIIDGWRGGGQVFMIGEVEKLPEPVKADKKRGAK